MGWNVAVVLERYIRCVWFGGLVLIYLGYGSPGHAFIGTDQLSPSSTSKSAHTLVPGLHSGDSIVGKAKLLGNGSVVRTWSFPGTCDPFL